MRNVICTLLLSCLMLAGCDRLDDTGAIREVLPGTWGFSYELLGDADLGVEFSYDRVVFGSDGTCAIAYEGGALTGTYQAGDAVIRIVSLLPDGSERIMLWRIRSFSPYEIETEYDFEIGGQQVTAVVTLTRLTGAGL